MCGIVGYVGEREAAPILLKGLRRLEYRGYDSAGVAIANGAPARIIRCRGKLIELERLLAAEPPCGSVGMGHTRWATHGPPSDRNAHPHRAGSVSVVHNGIIENHLELRRRLEAEGRVFLSETDTEIAAHLVDRAINAGATSLAEAVRAALGEVRGAYALVVMSDLFKEEIVAAKLASPLVLGIGAGETILASDVPALIDHTRKVVFLEDGDLAEVTRDGVRLGRVDAAPGASIQRPTKTVAWDATEAEKGGYPHFML